MLKFIFIISICLVSVNCQTNWENRACLVDHNGYFMKIMQKVIRRLETDVKWCNFKLPDITQQIDTTLFKFHAQGTVNYTNGFLVNFDRVDVTNIVSTFSSRTVDGVTQVSSALSGQLNFHLLNIGFDVSADLGEMGTHRFTATMPYTLFALRCSIVQNMNTKEITASTFLASSQPMGRRMLYAPDNHISDILSRNMAIWVPGNDLDTWGPTHIVPLLREVAAEFELPEIRYDYQC